MFELIDHPGLNKDPGCFKIEDYQPYLTVEMAIDDIKIYGDGHLHGGGTGYGQDLIPIIRQLYPHRTFTNGLEWCAGCGFIGFGLLAKDIIKNLWLAEIFRPAILACEKTIQNLPEKYHGATIQSLHQGDVGQYPKNLIFDLIVANPPHWDWKIKPFREAFNDQRICADNDWQIHRNFFQNIKSHLAFDGVILLQEASSASGPDTFRKMIDDHGLRINRAFQAAHNNEYWYLEIHHA